MTDPVLAAWLTVIGRDGWVAARIDAVADVAGTTTGRVAATFPDRRAALAGFGRALDVAALAEAGADRAAGVRDRLFAMIMARFDAAQDHRRGAAELTRAARRDPGLALSLALGLPQSVARLAEAAGVATGGLAGALRVQALTVLTLAVTRVWLTDDSTDLGATMKELDTRLAQAETWARRLPHRPMAEPAAAGPTLTLPAPAAPAAALRSAADLPPG